MGLACSTSRVHKLDRPSHQSIGSQRIGGVQHRSEWTDNKQGSPVPCKTLYPKGDLLDCLVYGRVDRFRHLVRTAYRDVNAHVRVEINSEEWRPLIVHAVSYSGMQLCSEQARVRMLEFLIGRKCNVNAAAKNCLCMRALHEACHVEVARLLLDNKADVNARDGLLRTPLMLAAQLPVPEYNSLELVRTLLDYGADPNLEDNRGRTALARCVDDNECAHRETLAALRRRYVELLTRCLDCVLPKDPMNVVLSYSISTLPPLL